MELIDILTPDAVVPHLHATSKKQALTELARHAAEVTGLDQREILDTLLERERLGTTGVGHGIAIPHGKLDALDRLHGLFARLDKPVDFDSIDDQPVDLLFVLLAPSSAGAEHLKALARVSRLLRDPQMCEKLRGADSADSLFLLLTRNEAAAA